MTENSHQQAIKDPQPQLPSLSIHLLSSSRDLSAPQTTQQLIPFVLIALTTAKKIILLNWKGKFHFSLNHWLNMVTGHSKNPPLSQKTILNIFKKKIIKQIESEIPLGLQDLVGRHHPMERQKDKY